MNFQLEQRDDKNSEVRSQNPMYINDILVRQSPSRQSDRTVSQPLFPASGASKTPAPPRVDLSDRRSSFPDRFSRDDRRPSSSVRERRDSRRDSYYDRDRRESRRDSYRDRDRDRRESRRDSYRDRDRRESRRDPLTDTEPVELDLLANPLKKKKTDPFARPEEDFSDHSQDHERKDDFVRDDERYDFERKNRSDSTNGNGNGNTRRDSRHRDSYRRDSRHSHRDSYRRDSRHRDSYRRDSRDRHSRSHSEWSGFGSSRYQSYEEEQQRKQRVMERFDKLMRRGIKVNPRFLQHDARLSEQEQEADRLEKHIEVEESIQFQRKAYMAFCTGVEFVSKKWNPVGIYLNGWSESVMEDIETYDPVFEDLHEKYHTQVSMSPEFKLMFMMLTSMFMYHLSNTLFKSQMPAAGGGADMDMMKNMRRSAMGAASGMMGGRPPRGGMGGVRQAPPAPPSFQHPMGSQSAPPSSFGMHMRGPNANTNDLLNEFMDRHPNDINDKILNEIDDILDNPSEDDDGDNNNNAVRNVSVRQPVTLDM